MILIPKLWYQPDKITLKSTKTTNKIVLYYYKSAIFAGRHLWISFYPRLTKYNIVGLDTMNHILVYFLCGITLFFSNGRFWLRTWHTDDDPSEGRNASGGLVSVLLFLLVLVLVLRSGEFLVLVLVLSSDITLPLAFLSQRMYYC